MWVNGGRFVQAEGIARENVWCWETSWLVWEPERRMWLRREHQEMRSGPWEGKLFVGLVGFFRTLALCSKWDRNLDNFEHINGKIQHASQNHAGFWVKYLGGKDRSKEMAAVVQSLYQVGYGQCGKKHLDSGSTWRYRCWYFSMGWMWILKAKQEKEKSRMTPRFLTWTKIGLSCINWNGKDDKTGLGRMIRVLVVEMVYLCNWIFEFTEFQSREIHLRGTSIWMDLKAMISEEITKKLDFNREEK